MTRPPRLLVLVLLLAALGICVGPVRAATLGHGHAPVKGFSGYVARDGAELGTGRLRDGVRGICLDTGSRWRWPDRVPPSHLVEDPVVGYLTSAWLPRSRTDPVLAAALWWAVGERLNSHPAKVAGHVALMQRETPRIAKRIVAAHGALVQDALDQAPPAGGYAAPTLTATRDRIGGIGLRSATGHWVAGLPVTLRLSGATLPGGGSTWHGTTGSAPLALEIQPAGPVTIRAEVSFPRVPSARFRLYTPKGERRQRIAASAGPTTVETRAEVAFTPAQPRLVTAVSSQVATVGAVLVDTVTVSGLSTERGSGPVTGAWQLLGPARPDRGAGCRAVDWHGVPVVAQGTFPVLRDGTVGVGATRISRGGCYTYVERLAPTPYTLEAPWTAPGIPVETSLVGPAQPAVPTHPLVDSGGESDGAPVVAERAVPTRIRLGAVGLNTTLSAVRFRGRTLTPPRAIGTAGIWRDGAAAEALVGTTVVVGHVSDDHDRSGAFKRLQRARRGQVVELTSPGATVARWRITSIAAVNRERLPRGIFQQSVQRRLVLVTCTDRVTTANGGFHYRKNLIVTAEPA